MKIRSKMNEIANRETIEKIHETKRQFLEDRQRQT